jgi:predicted DNA-binding protein
VPQLAIYLDEETAHQLDEAAERAGESRSAWVRAAILARLHEHFPESFFAVLGTWEDSRAPEQILRELRAGADQPERPELT